MAPFTAEHLPHLPAIGQIPSTTSANSVTYSSTTIQGEATDRDPASFAGLVPTSPTTFQGATGKPLAPSTVGPVPNLPSHRTGRSRPTTSTSSCTLVSEATQYRCCYFSPLQALSHHFSMQSALFHLASFLGCSLTYKNQLPAPSALRFSVRLTATSP
jgi:hypothetical protein